MTSAEEKMSEKEAKETEKFQKLVEEPEKNDENKPEEEQEEIKEDPYRFVTLFLFIMTLVSIFPIMISLQPVMRSLIFLFEIGSFEIYLISNLFVLGDIFFSFPAMYIIGKFGLKKGMSLGLLFTVFSSLIRLFLTRYFPLIYLGNVVGSFGMQLIISNLAKIVTLWFKDQNRPMVFALMAAIFAIGPIFALSLPSFFVDEDFSSRENKISQINNILYTILGVNILVFIIFVSFFREGPKNPVEKPSKEPEQPFWPSIKALFFNRNYRVFSLAFSYLASTFMLFNIFSHFILSPFGLNQQDISSVSMLIGIASLFGDVGSGIATKKAKSLKNLAVGYIVCLLVVLQIFMGCLHSYNKTVIFIGAFILGLFVASFHAITSMLLIRISRPISEVYSFGFGQILASVQMLINGIIYAQVYSGGQSAWAPFTFSFMTVTYIVALLCFCCLRLENKEQSESNSKEIPELKEEKKNNEKREEVEMT